MGVNKINLDHIETNASQSILRVLIKDVNESQENIYYLILPLLFKDFNKNIISIILKEMCKECADIKCCVQRTNSCMKALFGYLNDYIDNNGNAILNVGTWKEDNEEMKSELIRVLIHSLRECNAEVCVHKVNNDYTLIHNNIYYSYNKGNLQLSEVNESRLNNCKHLYGKRIYDFQKKKINNKNERGVNNIISVACADSEVEDTGKKIEALRTLCDMLKNAGDTTSDNTETTIDDTTEKVSDNKTKRTENNVEEEKIDIDDLREKIKKAQEEMQKEENRKSEEESSTKESSDTARSNMSEEMQKLFFYFLQNPSMLSKTIDQINNTIDQLTDQINPNVIFNRRKPIVVRKYFPNVNLVLKYIEMLKIIEMKYKQTIELRVQSDDFQLVNEAKEFNDHLIKIWNMINLILAELSALKINDFVSTVPQCGNIRFDTSHLFQKDQSYLQKQLQNLGFKTKNSQVTADSIKLPIENSENLLKRTIMEIQSTTIFAIRQVLRPYYIDLQNVLESSCSSTSSTENAIEDVINQLSVLASSPISTNLSSYTITAESNASATSELDKLKHLMSLATTVDVNEIIEACTTLVAEVYNIVNNSTNMFAKNIGQNTNSADVILHLLGANYENITSAGNTISGITLQTDNLIGLQFVLNEFTNVNNKFVPNLRNCLKSILSNLLYNTSATTTPDQITTNTISYEQIIAAFTPGRMADLSLPSYNPLSYVNYFTYASSSGDNPQAVANTFPIISASKIINGRISAQTLDDACASSYNLYGKLLTIVFSSEKSFKKAMTNKAEKSVIIEKRSRLINFLKQFENDVNLGLSFFGEMATLYNSTTNQNILNATPVCFSQYSANQRPTNNSYSNDVPNNRAPQPEPNVQQNMRAQAQENPAERQMNSPQNDSPETKTESESDEEEFKLPNLNSENRNFYSGSRAQYT